MQIYKLLDYGALGVMVIIVVVVVVPVVRAFLHEVRAARTERQEFWKTHLDFVQTESRQATEAIVSARDGMEAIAKGCATRSECQTDAMNSIRDSLQIIAQRLNGTSSP